MKDYAKMDELLDATSEVEWVLTELKEIPFVLQP
jgi:hypothetical protein